MERVVLRQLSEPGYCAPKAKHADATLETHARPDHIN
jgi:hypothetical protein